MLWTRTGATARINRPRTWWRHSCTQTFLEYLANHHHHQQQHHQQHHHRHNTRSLSTWRHENSVYTQGTINTTITTTAAASHSFQQCRSLSIMQAFSAYGNWKRLKKKLGKTHSKQHPYDPLLYEDSGALDFVWNEKYQQLMEFQKQHGHTTVLVQDNESLANWIKKQRINYRKYKAGEPTAMTHKRIRLLEQIDGFSWNPREQIWMERVAELKAYKDQHGDCLVPLEYPPNPALAAFVTRTRMDYREFLGLTPVTNKNERARLTQKHVDILNDLGFVWDMRELWWNDKYRELQEYLAHHGHVLVPQRYEANPELARWVRRQRELYAARMGTLQQRKPLESTHNSYQTTVANSAEIMTDERIAKLEAIGFCWNILEARWEKHFRELEEFVRIHGVGSRPTKRTNKALAEFLSRQRKQYAKGKLAPERLKKLEALGVMERTGKKNKK